MNGGQLLQLTASIVVSAGLKANFSWSVDDSSGLDLPRSALSPITGAVPVSGTSSAQSLYLAFSANVLPVGSTLSFKLTCWIPSTQAATSSSITISVNAPPQLGSFTVSPDSGVALSQVFTFAASQWVDSNLPITYQFGYVSNSGATVVMKSQSPTAFGWSQLPAGLDSADNKVSCVAQVFDSLNANTSASAVVTVTPGAVMNASSIAAYVLSRVTTVASADSIKQFAALSAYVLNTVDCSSAPNCSALNRQSCYKTTNTCGGCKSDSFVGVSGDSNTTCVSKITVRGSSTDVCTVTSDCSNLLSVCVSGHCSVPNKQCVNECSGHGRCIFVNSTNHVIDSCPLDDSTCSARCDCESNYSIEAVSCGASNADMLMRQQSRDVVIASVSTLFSIEDPSEQVVAGWTSSLIEVTQSSSELTVASTVTVLTLMSSVVSSANDLSLPSSTIGGLLISMSSVTSAVAMQVSNASASSSSTASVYLIQSVLQSYSSQVSSTLLPGMSAVSSTYDQFKLISQFTYPSSAVSLPLSELEVLSGVMMASSVGLPFGGIPTIVSLVSVSTVLFGGRGNSSDFYSDPLSLSLSSLPCSVPPCVVNITLQTLSLPQSQLALEHFNTSCSKGVISVSNHTCLNGFLVRNISCDGTEDYVIRSTCPRSEAVQACNILSGSNANTQSGCSAVAHTVNSVTCSCSIGPAVRRILSSSNDTSSSYSATYVAMLSSTTSTFVDTFESAGSLNNSTIKKGWKVLVTVGTFAAAVLIAILGAKKMDDRDTKDKTDMSISKAKNFKIQPLVKGRTKVIKVAEKKVAKQVVNLELALVEQSLPKVLSSSMSFNERFKAEIKRHHRWFCVVFLYSDTFPRALRVASLATNVIIMLFVQSITYNLTNPDDGSCEKMSTETSCLLPKSSFATGQSKCGWNPSSDSCYFIQPDNSIKIVLFVAIFSAIISTPIALLADWIIRTTISAPLDRSKVPVLDIHSGGASNLRQAEPTSSASRQRHNGASRLAVHGVSAAHIELSRLSEEIRTYRETLTTNEKKEFDFLWGLDEQGCFLTGNMGEAMVNSLWSQLKSVTAARGKHDTNVHQTVLGELKEVQQKTNEELANFSKPDGSLVELDAGSKLALGKKLLFLFQCDLLPGISGQILSSKGSRDFVLVKPVRQWKKVTGWVIVAALNVGMLFYILLFALDQTVHRQSAWFKSFILWLVVEIFVVSTGVVIVTHILLPSLIMKDVTKIKQRLLDNIRDFHANLAKKKENTKEGDESEVKPFNAAKYLFVSYRLAAVFPDVREAAIISQFSTPWPRQSYQHVVDVKKTYNRKYTAVSRSISVMLVFFLTNLLSIPPTFQDMLIHMVTTTTIGYTILLHLELFGIFPVLVIIPFLCLCVLVHFVIQAGKATARNRLSKLLPAPVVFDRNKTILKVIRKNRSRPVSASVEVSPLPKIEEVAVLDDELASGQWQNYSGFTDGRISLPASPSAASNKHITRRQSVAQGVQLLHQIQTSRSSFDLEEHSASSNDQIGYVSTRDRFISNESVEYGEDPGRRIRLESIDSVDLGSVLSDFSVSAPSRSMSMNENE